jgi:WXG100 family type VII secretion target
VPANQLNKVDFAAMDKAEAKFRDASVQAKDSRKDVQAAKDAAVASWQGGSANEFFRAIDGWLTQFDKVTKNLDNLTDALKTATKGYRGGEERNVQRASKLTSIIHG